MIERGSFSRVNRNSMVVRQYVFTDQSVAHNLGRGPTSLKFVGLCADEEELLQIDQLMHTPTMRTLTVSNFLYKEVIPDIEYTAKPAFRFVDGWWKVDLPFIALDPIPYSVSTGGVFY